MQYSWQIQNPGNRSKPCFFPGTILELSLFNFDADEANKDWLSL